MDRFESTADYERFRNTIDTHACMNRLARVFSRYNIPKLMLFFFRIHTETWKTINQIRVMCDELEWFNIYML
jgi:hypothetical protein